MITAWRQTINHGIVSVVDDAGVTAVQEIAASRVIMAGRGGTSTVAGAGTMVA